MYFSLGSCFTGRRGLTARRRSLIIIIIAVFTFTFFFALRAPLSAPPCLPLTTPALARALDDDDDADDDDDDVYLTPLSAY